MLYKYVDNEPEYKAPVPACIVVRMNPPSPKKGYGGTGGPK